MAYDKLTVAKFFRVIDTEEKARDLVWRARFGGKDFVCPHCRGEKFWQHKGRPEVRECVHCERQIRLRADTIFRRSKVSMLVWVRAIFLATQGKRGIAALEVYRQLEMRSYGTAWTMMQKIREAMRQRDGRYKLKGIIELDGASFGRRKTENQREILVAIETKKWVDERGRPKRRAGFAKTMPPTITKVYAQEFVTAAIEPGSTLHTDGAYHKIDGVEVMSRKSADGDTMNEWLPWVHRFISNAKAFLIGTHHGVEAKHLERYLAEYTFRFNRRHDPNSMFARAVSACAIATPITVHALSS